MSDRSQLWPTVMFRREHFGGLAYNPIREDFFFLNNCSLTLLREIDSKRIVLDNNSINQYAVLFDENVIGVVSPQAPFGERGDSSQLCEGMLRGPTHVELYPLLHCNERCRFCYVGYEVENPSQPPMGKDAIVATIDNLARAGVFNVTILGGEPFKYTHLQFLLDTLVAGGFDIAISTNGTVDDEEIFAIIALHGIKLNLALHADVKSIHDYLVRRSGAFDQCTQTIRRVAALDIPFNVTTVLTGLTIGRTKEVVGLVHELGGQGLTLAFPQRTEYCTANGQTIPFSDYAAAYASAFSYGMEIGVHVKSSYHYDFVMDQDITEFDIENPMAEYLYGDRSGRYCIEVMPNADAYPSYELFGRKEWCIGNLAHDELSCIWRTSQVLDLFRKRPLPDACRTCQYRHICRGGQVSRGALAGDINRPPDDCPILLKEWPKGIGSPSKQQNLIQLF